MNDQSQMTTMANRYSMGRYYMDAEPNDNDGYSVLNGTTLLVRKENNNRLNVRLEKRKIGSSKNPSKFG